jgi:hypothetical protein
MEPSDKEHETAVAEYRSSLRTEAIVACAVGAALLAAAFYLAKGDVPLMRQGRLLLAAFMGGAAILYGLKKIADSFADL